MKRCTFRNDANAVSSVISVVLLVAVTVILGSVVSVFALGLAEDVGNVGPQASFEFEFDDSTGDVIVTQTNGDTIHGDQLRFAGAALEKTTYGGITEWAGGEVETGDSATVNVKAGEALRVSWQSSESDETATLGEYDVPDDAGPSGSVSITNVQSVNDEVSVSVGTLSKVDGNANLVVETASSAKTEQSVSSGATPTLSLSVDETEDVTVTLYESDETGEIASDTGSATRQASIGSITDENGGSFNYLDNYIRINNIQFNGVPDDQVYVVVKDTNGDLDERQYFSNYGGNLQLHVGIDIQQNEQVTVTVYDEQGGTVLTTAQATG